MTKQLQNTASFAAIAAALAFSSMAQAGALPSNGHFVSGQGQIGKAGQSLTVKQSSTTGIINWSSFTVGKNSSVSFNNGSGATLNRVTGGNLSTIAGSLHATGSLFLMNSVGVIVSGTGHIVTGGSFVASSGDVAGDAFGSHRLRFNTGNGIVINRGSITSGGNAILNGRGVANEGNIAASSVRLSATGNVFDSGTITASGSAHHGAAHIYLISQSGKTRITGNLTAHGSNGAGSIETSGHSLSIGGNIDAGNGGTWRVDPEDLVVRAKAATTIDDALNGGTNVTLQTTASGTSGPGTVKSGPGDIEVMAPLSWNTAATLTLDAYHSVQFNDLVLITGAGNLAIVTNDGGTGGEVRFLDSGSVDYGATDNGGSLTINGDSFTLVYNMSDLQNINSNLNANYALATSQDATSVSNWLPIGIESNSAIANAGKGFVGNFEGLGNTISNLVLNAQQTTRYTQYLSLFGYASSGTISDLGMIGGSVNGNFDEGSMSGAVAAFANNIFNCFSTAAVSNYAAGGVVGSVTSISYSYATGSVSGFEEIGGLAGIAANTSNSYATGNVTGNLQIGGLIGNSGNVSNSYATGDISAESEAGGLIGFSGFGQMTHVHATGTVAGDGLLGGLIGYSESSIKNAYAKGKITANPNEGGESVGGLVGLSGSGSIIHSHATGAVVGAGQGVGGLVGKALASADAEIVASYATGNVSGEGYVGGLVGEDSLVAITSSYASGKVTGAINHGAFGMYAGGLVGLGGATISNSHATGAVSGESRVGGLAGAGGIITNSYATGNVHAQGGYAGGLAGRDNGAGQLTISDSYATGRVYGRDDVGGLAGAVGKAKISDAYATGAVHGKSGVGGFVGLLHSGTIFTSYSTGAVYAHGKNGGGFVGKNQGQFINDFWDTDTSGLSNGTGNSESDGVTGLTTAQFQSGLPTGFDSSVWAEDPSINGGLPYLISLAASY